MEFRYDESIRAKQLEDLQQRLEASEQECFAERQRALIAESISRGVRQDLRARIGLELEGMEDIYDFLPIEAVAAIRERVSRIRKIIEEKGKEEQ